MSTRSLEKVVSEDFELEKKINPSVKIQNGGENYIFKMTFL
jgi:hypothetical protein